MLQHLACIGNPLTALEPLPALASIAAQRCGVACLADLRPLALAPHLTRLALAGNPCVAGLSPRHRRVLIGNLLPGARLPERRLAAGRVPASGQSASAGCCLVQHLASLLTAHHGFMVLALRACWSLASVLNASRTMAHVATTRCILHDPAFFRPSKEAVLTA